MTTPVRPSRWPLAPAPLLRAAQLVTGLEDFGDHVPLRVPLAVLCDSLNTEVGVHPIGRLALRRLIVASLASRLRLVDLARRQPQLFARPVTAPVIIVGPPRSGTTFLHRLLARDPGARTAPFWELWSPVPPAGHPAHDPRVAAGRRVLALARWAAPGLRRIHELDNDAPDEEVIVMAGSFSSLLYEWIVGVPSFAAWYRSADHGPGYDYLRTALQAMQGTRPVGGRWILKATQHLEHLGPLLRTFPDATVVHTHRDPATAVVSLASFVAYGARTYLGQPDPHQIGGRCADMVERLLAAALRDRVPTDPRFVDVYFDELCADPMAVVHRIHAAARRPLSEVAVDRMRAWLPENRRGRFGPHRYAPADFGLNPAALRARFDRYYRRHPRVAVG